MSVASNSQSRLLSMDVKLNAVVAELGYMPVALAGAMSTRVFDLVRHARRSVLAHYTGPGGRGAQRFLASRLFRHAGRRKGEGVPTSLTQVQGEFFGAAQTGKTFGDDVLGQLERGGTISSGNAFAIPLEVGRSKFRFKVGDRAGEQESRLMRAIREGKTFLVKKDGRLLVMLKARSKNREARVIGIVTRSRVQRPLLGFYNAFDKVLPTHLEKIERAIELARTAAGQSKLALQAEQGVVAGKAFNEAFKLAMEGGAKAGDARRIAKAAAEAARRDMASSQERGGR